MKKIIPTGAILNYFEGLSIIIINLTGGCWQWLFNKNISDIFFQQCMSSKTLGIQKKNIWFHK